MRSPKHIRSLNHQLPHTKHKFKVQKHAIITLLVCIITLHIYIYIYIYIYIVWLGHMISFYDVYTHVCMESIECYIDNNQIWNVACRCHVIMFVYRKTEITYSKCTWTRDGHHYMRVCKLMCLGVVCWSLTSLCHSNGHIETMPAREINPFTALSRIRSQFLRTQWSTRIISEWTILRVRPLSHRGWHMCLGVTNKLRYCDKSRRCIHLL